jgi:hypothetical protein
MNRYRRAPLDHTRAQAAISTLTDVICGPHPLHASAPARLLAHDKLLELLSEVELDQAGEIAMRRPYDTGRAPGRGSIGGAAYGKTTLDM